MSEDYESLAFDIRERRETAQKALKAERRKRQSVVKTFEDFGQALIREEVISTVVTNDESADTPGLTFMLLDTQQIIGLRVTSVSGSENSASGPEYTVELFTKASLSDESLLNKKSFPVRLTSRRPIDEPKYDDVFQALGELIINAR